MKYLTLTILFYVATVLPCISQTENRQPRYTLTYEISVNCLSRYTHQNPKVKDNSEWSFQKLEFGRFIKNDFGYYFSIELNFNESNSEKLPNFTAPDYNPHDYGPVSFNPTEAVFLIGGMYIKRFGKFSITPKIGIGYTYRNGGSLSMSYLSPTSTDITQYNLNTSRTKWAPVIEPGFRLAFHCGNPIGIGIYLGLDYMLYLRHRRPDTLNAIDVYTGEQIIPTINLKQRSPLCRTIGFTFYL